MFRFSSRNHSPISPRIPNNLPQLSCPKPANSQRRTAINANNACSLASKPFAGRNARQDSHPYHSAPTLSETPLAGTLGVPSPLAAIAIPVADLAQLRTSVESFSCERAWEWVHAARAASPAPPRRHLPGSATPSGSATYSRRLAAAACLVVLTLAADGHAPSQILSLHLPLIILRRGIEIPGQIVALARNELPLPADPLNGSSDPIMAWCLRLSRSHEAGENRRLCDLLAAGPDNTSVSSSEAPLHLDRLFPYLPEGEYRDSSGRCEADVWDSSGTPFSDNACKPVITARNVLRWARTHSAKAADLGGWTGRIILDLFVTEPLVVEACSKFVALPPHCLSDDRARSAAYRLNSGVLLSRPGKDPRPISAPSIFRKLRSAVDARRARPAVSAFCERRGQVGLSSAGALLSYSLFPRLTVDLGGTTVGADNTNSFQRFTRTGLLTGALSFLSSSAAIEHPAATAAAARLFDVCLFDSRRHRMPRTMTVFSRLGSLRTSHALSQGCSSSPTLEAITLAASPANNPMADGVRPKLTLRRAAHDDFQASGLPGCRPESLAPPPPFAGSVYNTLKSIAVGPLAPALVAAGHASRASSYASVFGSPVGDALAWAREHWAPRMRSIMNNLRVAYTSNPEVAILTAHTIRGPGASAIHWLRTTPVPTGSSLHHLLETVDTEWLLLVLEFSGYNHTSTPKDHRLTPSELAICRDRLYGVGPHCLAHLSAAWNAPLRYAEGCARAWPTLSRWIAETPDADWRTFARLLGVPQHLLSRGCSQRHDSGRPVDAHFRSVLQDSTDTYRQRCTDAAARVASFSPTTRLSRGAQSSPNSVANGHANVLVAALGRSGVLTPAGKLTEIGQSSYAGLHLCLLFGLPVWPALGVHTPRPETCKHCSASAVPASIARLPRSLCASLRSSTTGSPIGHGSLSSRNNLDDYGLHLQSCTRSGIIAGSKWKHDTIVRSLADLSAACGRGGRYHDRRLFVTGPKQRPADLLQDAKNPMRYPEGEAIDFTYGISTVHKGTAVEREAAKISKFNTQLRLHPYLLFSPFAVTHDGDVGPSAHRLMLDWSTALAMRMASLQLPSADCRGDIFTAACRAVTRATIAQLVQWKLYERRLPIPIRCGSGAGDSRRQTTPT